MYISGVLGATTACFLLGLLVASVPRQWPKRGGFRFWLAVLIPIIFGAATPYAESIETGAFDKALLTPGFLAAGLVFLMLLVKTNPDEPQP